MTGNPNRQRLHQLLGRAAQSLGVDNPLLAREVLTTMRLRSVKGAVILLPALITLLVLIVAAETSRSIGGVGSAAAQGMAILGSATTAALYIVGLFGAVLGAQAIANERQAGTLDLVLSTGMSPSRIVAGKALAAWVVLAFLVLSALTPLGACFVVGGVSLTQLLLAVTVPLAVGIVPVAFGLCLGTAQRSARLAVGASVATIGLGGPMLFSALWVAVIAAIGVDDLGARGPFTLPSGDEGALALFSGGFLLPLYLIAVPTWLFLAIAVGALSGAATDRARPLRRWFTVAGPAGGVIVALISLAQVGNDADLAVLLISALGGVLTVGALALAGHRPARAPDLSGASPAILRRGPGGDALFATAVSALSLLPATLVLTIQTGPQVLWATAVVLAFVVMLSGLGVLLTSELQPRLARWSLVGLTLLVTLGPLLLALFFQMAAAPGASRDASQLASLFSPIGAMVAIDSNRSFPGHGFAPALSITLWLILGLATWKLGAMKLRERAGQRRASGASS